MNRRGSRGFITPATMFVVGLLGLGLPVTVAVHHPVAHPAGPLASCRSHRTPACPRVLPPPSPIPVVSRETVERILRLASRDVGVRLPLLRSVALHESAMKSNAVSPVGARGVLQTMPATAHEEGCDRLEDAVCGIYAGARHLARLLGRYHGDKRLALAAYNAGEGAVERYGGVPPYAETKAYVAAILADVEPMRR